MTWMEGGSAVERRAALRAQGNEHFRSARYEQALALYDDALQVEGSTDEG